MTTEEKPAWDWAETTREALGKFLADHSITQGPVTTKAIGDGHSNLTYLVSDGRTEVVVRRPPPPPIPKGANDVLREATILTGLGAADFAVPDVLATAEAGELLDVPLYVMTFAPGAIVTGQTPSVLATAERRKSVGHSLVDTLARLHAVDIAEAGLGDLGRPEGFNLRHIKSMRRLLDHAGGGDDSAFDELHDWLIDNAPAESGAAIVHLDYRIGNLVIDEATASVQAVLDWELATLGDPLLDLGNFLVSVPVRGRALNPTAELSRALLEDGYPTREELAERYAEHTGADISRLPWYEAMSLWKLAVLYEYSRDKAVGGSGDPYYLRPGLVDSFLAEAEEIAGALK
ncbi:phosphotransferase family protein [Brevibacterium aurantiacum]|uniref:Phosphotransferase family protein n=1 Tax=Brevibacterium aurantiacum TaxID=273384 RepID=A0A4Z0KI79_BREAU|nr:phosphotransferase family protein [Brevibacterium aurantiacum]TGD37039.1 phosphotransferase family protein [Brevibacterium aurantiacum]